MTGEFSGIWPAMLTPLDPAGEPNHDQIEKLVDLFARQCLDGLYVLGSTGQGVLLNVSQRRAVAERVVKAAAGRIPVMIHVGCVATDDAVSLAKHAAKIGADAVSSVATIYYPVAANVVFEHYRRIGAATGLPLFVYHLSAVNQLSLPPREYADRVLELPNIAGMKITDHDLYQFGLIHAHAAGRLRLFSGADELLLQASLSGAIGAIGTFYNLWGPTCQAVRRSFVTGSFDEGRRFMLAFQTAIDEILRSGSIWSFLRSAMRLRHEIEIGPPKAPLGILDKPWQDAEVERIVRQVENY